MTKAEAGKKGGLVTASRYDMVERGKLGGRPTFWETLERAKPPETGARGQARLAQLQRKGKFSPGA